MQEDLNDNEIDFPLVSVGTGEEVGLLADAPAGESVVIEETLFEATGTGTAHDEEKPVGTVTIVQWKSPREGRVPFTAHFAIGPEGEEPEIVALTGVVPGNGSWRGRGRVAYGGGTGKFEGRTGSLPLLSENPKRWG